jgi:hypothetical protein
VEAARLGSGLGTGRLRSWQVRRGGFIFLFDPLTSSFHTISSKEYFALRDAKSQILLLSTILSLSQGLEYTRFYACDSIRLVQLGRNKATEMFSNGSTILSLLPSLLSLNGGS